eukprot:COSAG03_NODE_1930_length_3344_cov_1.757165_2_plen_74_part_00
MSRTAAVGPWNPSTKENEFWASCRATSAIASDRAHQLPPLRTRVVPTLSAGSAATGEGSSRPLRLLRSMLSRC